MFLIAFEASFTAIIVTFFVVAAIVLFVLSGPLLLRVDSVSADIAFFGKAIIMELFMKVEEMPQFAGCVKP